MFNLTITVDTDTDKNPPCIHVPRDTCMASLVSFFNLLGLEVKASINSDSPFLDIINAETGQSVAWVLLSGTHLKVVK